LNLITEYPLWFIIFSLLAGLLYAFSLYFREKRAEFSVPAKWLMASLRFLSISIIAFLLLSPMVKTMSKNEEKPKILFFQDNSESISNNTDSLFYTKEYPKLIDNFITETQGKFEIKKYSFGQKIKENGTIDFDEPKTNISEIANLCQDNFSHQNIGAVIVASDGIYNSGSNPYYAFRDVQFPIFTIALGDTNEKADIRINEVAYNEVVFLDNEFPLEINIQANRCKNETLKINIHENGKIIDSKQIKINKIDFNTTLSFVVKAEKPGLHKLNLTAEPLSNEENIQNNSTEIFVEVIDNKNKILLLYHSPHPDIAALKSALTPNKNYGIEISPLSLFNKKLDEFSLVILHQIPANTFNSTKIANELKQSKLPVLYILGQQSSLGLFNAQKTGLNINTFNAYENAFPSYNPDFTSFTISEQSQNMISRFTPLQVHLGNYSKSTSIQNLFFQKIGNQVTDLPLICFNTASENKIGIICGEGLWRWRVENHKINGDQLVFNNLMSKIVQYLSLKEDKRNFRVELKNKFAENENVVFEAQLYNDNYELVSGSPVQLSIEDENQNAFPYEFGKKGDYYYLDAGKFPVGKYSFRAQTKLGDKLYNSKGIFAVSKLNIESLNLKADHGLLFRLAQDHDGELLYPEDLGKLAKELTQNNNSKTIINWTKTYTELINLPWLLALILFLLSLEWFLRKWGGSY
jgi:hypothetical protein